MPRLMEISTPLGEDLLFHGMHAREELGRPSTFHLDLLSPRGTIDLDEILGKNVTVKVALQDDSIRYFNGYVTRFAQRGMYGRYHRYAADVSSWLWFLTRTADCRIFQDMTVPDIVKRVFGEHPTNDVAVEVTGSYRTRTYCVQYRETDFNFVSRLLEEEGIYYYFRHTDGHHTLVLADSASTHTPTPGYEEVPFVAPGEIVRPEQEHIGSWEHRYEIQPGVYAHADFDFERPSVKLRAQKSRPRSYTPSDYEVFDYPGLYVQKSDGEQSADVRIDEYATQVETAEGVANARGLCTGALVTLTGCPRDDQNREYLIVGTSHDLEFGNYEGVPESDGGASFRCSFATMPSRQQFRPRRATPKPFVQGPQTAKVTGPAGDEIYTDAFGRVKVQFHWDRYGTEDENSSCWIRVSHPWAGKGWGAVATPRIGQEVIVDFLEGDPDQPIITGRVYNAESQPPFGFPAGAVISGLKSQTHKGAGYNEISADDTAGNEKITIHGQFDMNTTVEHDQTSTIHNNRTDKVDVDDSETIGNNQTWSVGVNRDASIGSNETLTVGANRTKSVGANETITVGANRSSTVSGSETATVALQRTHSVGINETISVGAAQEITVGGLQAITVGAVQMINVGASQSTSVGVSQSTSVGTNQSLKVGAAQNVDIGAAANLKVGADQGIKVTGGRASDIGKDDAIKVGKNFMLDAGDSITLKTGDASIVMKKDGTIQIKGKDISIKGSGKINAKANSNVVIKGSKVGIN